MTYQGCASHAGVAVTQLRCSAPLADRPAPRLRCLRKSVRPAANEIIMLSTITERLNHEHPF